MLDRYLLEMLETLLDIAILDAEKDGGGCCEEFDAVVFVNFTGKGEFSGFSFVVLVIDDVDDKAAEVVGCALSASFETDMSSTASVTDVLSVSAPPSLLLLFRRRYFSLPGVLKVPLPFELTSLLPLAVAFSTGSS
jgi:hypothetical protein